MDEDILDPMEFSVDEIRAQFEKHKLSCEQRVEQNKKLTETFRLDREFNVLHEDVRLLQDEIIKLEELQMRLTCWHDPDAIESWPTIIEKDIKNNSMQQQKEKVKQLDKLFISSGSSPCLFENCRRKLNSQLLLLHYLTDHNEEHIASQRLRQLHDDGTVIFTFETKRCNFRQNHVLGLIAYGSKYIKTEHLLTGPRRHIYNSFLPQQLVHLECDLPVVVLICKTSGNLQMRDADLSHCEDMVYVIWLVTPYNLMQLKATLCLFGRDPAVQARSTVPVRLLQEDQNTSKFMQVDDVNYWCLSSNEIRKISNNFRDELHLEVGLSGTFSGIVQAGQPS